MARRVGLAIRVGESPTLNRERNEACKYAKGRSEGEGQKD